MSHSFSYYKKKKYEIGIKATRISKKSHTFYSYSKNIKMSRATQHFVT